MKVSPRRSISFVNISLPSKQTPVPSKSHLCASTASLLSRVWISSRVSWNFACRGTGPPRRHYYYKWKQFRELDGGGAERAESGYNFNKSTRLCSSRRVESSWVASHRVALHRIGLPGTRDAFSRRRIPPSLSVPTLSAA